MSGEKRLNIAFELYEIARNICEAGILEANPGISDAELKRLLIERFSDDPRRCSKKGRK
ncbi:MAG: hypothetical protein AB1546_12655 [bacterium]